MLGCDELQGLQTILLVDDPPDLHHPLQTCKVENLQTVDHNSDGHFHLGISHDSHES